MNPNDFIKNILNDIKVDLTEEFDRNFERKAFFDKEWGGTKLPNSLGSRMARTGKLRRSVKSKESGNQVSWSSSLPYATIQNNGGQIKVTAKMKSFFWAMFYKASGAAGKGKSERSQRLSAEAQQWKNLALMKVGHVMKIEQSQFIGDHPIVRKRIEEVIGLNFKELETYYFNKLKQR